MPNARWEMVEVTERGGGVRNLGECGAKAWIPERSRHAVPKNDGEDRIMTYFSLPDLTNGMILLYVAWGRI